MALKRWDPFKDLLFFQERMSRIFNEALSRRMECSGFSTGSWYPPVDIYETGDSIILKAELPGIEPDNVSVEVKENVLTLKGERKLEKNLTEENYHRMERPYGSFQRVFNLPNIVDKNEVKASFKDGILEIKVPKAQEARPGRIKIKVE